MSTKIEWTDEVWNPVTGCTKVSQGCKNCYAERFAERFWRVRERKDGTIDYDNFRKFTEVRCHEDRLDIPSHWRKPRRIFVNSMSDLFHEDVPDEFIWRVFKQMTFGNRRHTYQILTKRPKRMYDWFEANKERFWHYPKPGKDMQYISAPWPDPCIWLGVSCEDQETADERIPVLLHTPAAVRFVSCEPLLGGINLESLILGDDKVFYEVHPLRGEYRNSVEVRYGMSANHIGALDWVIVGGESGPHARPMHPDWVRSIRDQCQAAEVPFFFKQWGEYAPVGKSVEAKEYLTVSTVMQRVGKKAAGRLLDGREWNEYPEAN